MENFGIPVEAVPWDLTLVLEILGVPQAVSHQAGLEELIGEIFTLQGT
jgi:hypothetical protein